MGYYTRVLSTKEDSVALAVLTSVLKEKGCEAFIRSEVEIGPDDWEQLTLSHADGLEIASIERNVVEEESLGEEELRDFRESLGDALPESAAKWLRNFLPRVRCIYAFQHLSGTGKEGGFAALAAVRNAIWAAAPAVLQADGEGFSNEDGYQITWEFSAAVTGNWWMGVLQGGKWIHFEMDLGNRAHRKAFKSGLVPDGVKLA